MQTQLRNQQLQDAGGFFVLSIAFSRCASLTSMPPNFDFQP